MPDVFTKAKRSQVMSHIRGRANKDTEIALAKFLRRNRITGWRRQVEIRGRDAALRRPQTSQRDVPTFRVRPDFVFRQARLALFVDGCFWHGCPKHATKPKSNRAFWHRKLSRNKQRDRLVNQTLRLANWRVLRIWEHDLQRAIKKPQNEVRLLKRIKRALQTQI
jgi:DNA mismatch endonuclease (patch repair protein)